MFNLFGRKKRKLDVVVSPMLDNKSQEKKEPEKKPEPPAKRRAPEELEKIKENKEAIEALKKVKDPELDVDIWSLGLVYDIEINDKNVNVNLTFTSPMCPMGEQILRDVNNGLKGVGLEPNVNLVFNPPWEPTQELRDILGV
jgi:metal-sulfur cluster biosynthetic enzyme